MTAAGEPALRGVREERAPGGVPLYIHPLWAERFPWLVQGTTARGDDGGFDLRLFGDLPVGTVLGRWRALREAVGLPRAVHARQVHGAAVLVHGDGPPGLLVADAYDAHATAAAGVLLTVSVADCVPVSLVDADRRAVALLHAGWRGVAAGVLEAGVAALARLAGTAPSDLHVHFGPAICGACYEVGPEVHEALGLPVPAAPAPVDLRGVLAARARRRGVADERISGSAFCTRCGGSPFFSHRGGSAARQVGVLGVRPGG